MGRRTKARECAFQMLYQWDITREEMGRVVAAFWKIRRTTEPARLLAERLACGTQAHAAEIDAQIQAHAAHWRFDRIAGVERNILRLGSYELMREDTPSSVVIDEAVELAKRFGEAESSAFVNGVLDAIKRAVRPEEAVAATSEVETGKDRRVRDE